MSRQEFEAALESGRGGGTFVTVPFDPRQQFGAARVRVVGTVDGRDIETSITTMGSRAVLGIHKATRLAIGKSPGDTVSVCVEADERPRVVDVPPDLRDALSEHPDLSSLFENLSFTARKEFARWVASAKRPETRARRLSRTMEMIQQGETL